MDTSQNQPHRESKSSAPPSLKCILTTCLLMFLRLWLHSFIKMTHWWARIYYFAIASLSHRTAAQIEDWVSSKRVSRSPICMNTLGSRGYFFVIDTDGSRRSRVNEWTEMFVHRLYSSPVERSLRSNLKIPFWWRSFKEIRAASWLVVAVLNFRA